MSDKFADLIAYNKWDADPARDYESMDHDMLIDGLATAYKALLHQPFNKFRITHQELYAHVRDGLADAMGLTPEVTQDIYEKTVAEERAAKIAARAGSTP